MADTIQTKTVEEQRRQKWALLIGVNHYIPGNARLGQDGKPLVYRNLKGPANDVERVEKYLIETHGLAQSDIWKLTATEPSQADESNPRERKNDWPTRENIEQALRELTEKAQSGDFVYIHYSGHGARVKSIYQDYKEEGAMDEALAPTEVNCGGAYFRDVEFAWWLKKMMDKKLLVTVVLDSCHSGGAVRGEDDEASQEVECAVREPGGVDLSKLDTDTPRIPEDELGELFRHLNTIPVAERDTWLLKPGDDGHVLLAACEAHEKACETLYGGTWHGAFTHWLMHTLELKNANATHQMLFGRAFAKVNSQFHRQNPVSGGAVSRFFLGGGGIHGVSTFGIAKIQQLMEGGTVILNAGDAHGVLWSDKLEVFPWDIQTYDSSTRLATVQVDEVEEFTSTAKFIEILDRQRIEAGSRAVLVWRPKWVQLVVDTDNGYSKDGPSQLELALKGYSKSVMPMKIVREFQEESSSQTAYMYRVMFSEQNKFQLFDKDKIPIPHLLPQDSAEELLNQVAHIALFQWIRGIRNSEDSAMDGSYIFEARTNEESGSQIEVAHQDTLSLVFKNKTSQRVYLTVLGFSPLWGITCLFPVNKDREDINPGSSRKFPIRMKIPQQVYPQAVTDTLKAFVTLQPTSFAALEIDDIQEDGTFPAHRGEDDDIAHLLGKLTSPYRNTERVDNVIGWATREVKVTTIAASQP